MQKHDLLNQINLYKRIEDKYGELSRSEKVQYTMYMLWLQRILDKENQEHEAKLAADSTSSDKTDVE